MSTRLGCIVTLTLIATGFGNSQTPDITNETGALSFAVNSGVSIGIPAVRAGVTVNNVVALSPQRTVLPTVGVDASVRAWRWFVPYADFNFIDTGKATATIDSVTSTAQATTFLFAGGMRVMRATTRFRPYLQVGGGLLHQSLSGSLAVPGVGSPVTANGSINVISYGGGIQFHTAHKVGMDIGFEGYRFLSPMLNGGQNAGTIKVGFFYQTKSSVD